MFSHQAGKHFEMLNSSPSLSLSLSSSVSHSSQQKLFFQPLQCQAFICSKTCSSHLTFTRVVSATSTCVHRLVDDDQFMLSAVSFGQLICPQSQSQSFFFWDTMFSVWKELKWTQTKITSTFHSHFTWKTATYPHSQLVAISHDGKIRAIQHVAE